MSFLADYLIDKIGEMTMEEIDQRILDAILQEYFSLTCPDCGAEIGKRHFPLCDVARCEKTREQYMTCGCGAPPEIWDGYWPFAKVAHALRLVYKDGNDMRLDLNEAQRRFFDTERNLQ